MNAIPATIKLPLRIDEDGAIRIGSTRVLLEVVVGAYQRGDSPEQIAEDFPTVGLSQIYAVLAYYITNRTEVDEYISQVEAEGEALRRQFQAGKR